MALLKIAGAAVLCSALGYPALVLADAGHDHGAATSSSATAASPRVSGQSDLFEIVGVVGNGEMTITLDRYPTNEPVTDARIEVEAGSAKGLAIPQESGNYLFKHELLKQPGSLPISFTVQAGADADLLAGDLVLPGNALATDDHSTGSRWVWVAVGIALLLTVLAGWLLRRRFLPKKSMGAITVIAISSFLVSATASFDAQADAGHDHGPAATAANGNAPQRLPSGDVFLPKSAQRQLSVRTVLAVSASLPQTLELSGRVVMDPNASGRVQPTIAGRLEAGPRGLPQLGQAVRKGELLAQVRASANPIERANQVAQTSELQANLVLAQQRAARLAQLEGTVAQKDIDAAKTEAASLRQRLQAVQASVSATEPLLAPVSGVIAVRNAALGQVVEARELLFEIVDPARLMVEANAFDAALAGNIASASIALPAAGAAAGGAAASSLPLQFVGAGRSLREGAIPLLFRATNANPLVAQNGNATALPLAVHQSVKLQVQTKAQVQGFAVAAGAIVKSASNQDAVWVHTEAEIFVQRPVRLLALDGARVAVLNGLQAGDRVVTQGAALLSQVR